MAILLLLNLLLRPLTGVRHRIQDRLRGMGKSDWKIVEGRIHSCQIGSTDYEFEVTLLYSYSSEGEYWSGETSRKFPLERDAEAYEDAHRPGAPLMVRVCPGNPNRSVVLSEDQKAVSPVGTI